MSTTQDDLATVNADPNTLEYGVAGAVVLLFGLLYYWLNPSLPSLVSGAKSTPIVTEAVTVPAITAVSSVDETNNGSTPRPLAFKSTPTPLSEAELNQVRSELLAQQQQSLEKLRLELTASNQLTLEQTRKELEAQYQAQLASMPSNLEINKSTQPTSTLIGTTEKINSPIINNSATNNSVVTERFNTPILSEQSTNTIVEATPLPQSTQLEVVTPNDAENKSSNLPPQTTSLNTSVVSKPSTPPLEIDGKANISLPIQPLFSSEQFKAKVENYMAAEQWGKPIVLDYIDFTDNTAQITKESPNQLIALAELLKQYPNIKGVVRSYIKPTDNFNNDSILSLARSQQIKNALVYEGINSNRINIEGLSQLKQPKSHPVAADHYSEIIFIPVN